METLGSSNLGQQNIDLSKFQKDELIIIIKDLISENIALKEKIHSLEIVISQDSPKAEAPKLDIKDHTTTESFLSENTPKPKNSTLASSMIDQTNIKNEDNSEESKDGIEEDTIKKENKKEVIEIDDIDTETYFQQMTGIIRDMAKSPSMILTKREADYLHGQYNNKIHKEKCDIKMWEKEIIPMLDDKDQKAKARAKIKTVIYNFIPSKYRFKVWPFLIGNPLRIKRAIYDNYCKLLEANPIEQRVSYLIAEDLVRTYPSFKSFNKGEALNSELQCLLELFHFARPDIGYVQGMVYPAAMLLLHMDRYHAFKCLMNMVVASPFLVSLYNFKLDRLKLLFRAFDYYLQQKCPAASKHLTSMNVQTETFLIEWYYTLYCRTFSIHDAALIWDVYLMEGEIVFLRVALRIFQAIEPQLLKRDFSQTLQYIRSCTADINIDTIFKNMYNSKMTPERLERFYERERKKGPITDSSICEK